MKADSYLNLKSVQPSLIYSFSYFLFTNFQYNSIVHKQTNRSSVPVSQCYFNTRANISTNFQGNNIYAEIFERTVFLFYKLILNLIYMH